MNMGPVKQKLQSNEGNCLIYGCVSVFLLGIIGVLVVGFGLRSLYTQFRDNFTDEEAMVLPIVEVSYSERDAIIERYDTWVEAVEDNEDGGKKTLALSEKDINVLIQHHEEMEEMNGKVYVTINDATITGQVSVPLDGIPGFSGRYFNGSADFEVELENGRLSLYATALSVKGEAVPDEAMEQIKNKNLAKDLNSNPDTQELFENIELIEVKDGIVTIISTGAGEEEEKDAA